MDRIHIQSKFEEKTIKRNDLPGLRMMKLPAEKVMIHRRASLGGHSELTQKQTSYYQTLVD